jgi:heme-binding NEAT domain protein
MKFFSKLFSTVVLVLAILILFPLIVNAQSISYRPLKYGTNQNSMATGYFVQPADVVVRNHAYYVTMQIKTAKSLSSFPVKVIWVNGHAPRNVRRVKDRAGNSHLYYSFYARNLNKRINAKLAIDVPKIYKAKHLISFKFKTAGLPQLTSTKKRHATSSSHEQAAKTPTTGSKHSISQSQTQSQPAKTTKNQPQRVATSQKQPASKQPKKTAVKKPASTKTPKQAAAQPSKANSSSQQQSEKPAKAKAQQSSDHAARWILGSVVGLAAVGSGVWIYLKR